MLFAVGENNKAVYHSFMKPDPRTPHQLGRDNKPEHVAWSNMHHRCRNPKTIGWAHYGGRGIKVCARWNSFANFLEDIGKRPSPAHSLDRRDNDKGYSKQNCRWATREEQDANKITTRRVEFEGKMATFAELSKRFNVPARIIRKRVTKSKLSVFDAIHIPIQPARRIRGTHKLIPLAID